MYYFKADYPDLLIGPLYTEKVELHIGGEVIVGTDVTISGVIENCPDAAAFEFPKSISGTFKLTPVDPDFRQI